MILLHGGGGTGKAWWYQLECLSTHFRVIAPDMPGFGQSEKVPGIERVSDIVVAIQGWLGVWNIERFAIGGNSMGGRVALGVAAQMPTQVRALMLLDAVGVNLKDVPIVNPLTLPPDQFMSGLVKHPDRYRKLTPYRTLSDAQELNHGRHVFAQYLGNDGIASDPSLDLTRVNMPTLLLWGRDDIIVPVEYGRQLEKALADAELLIIDDVGHLPHIEEPQMTCRTMADFLSRHANLLA
ncbi:alpha/beta fold hydrolase [Sulfobacillus thermotolerans]|uniref:alpha/beta fold hydrolase n=1 Tax=Sulfobacillus thermotolerans TaxID=338644 RepID=UPI00336867F7